MGHIDKGPPKSINTVGEGIYHRYDDHGFRQAFEGKQCTGKKEKGHDQKVNNNLKTLHVFYKGCNGRSEGCKCYGDEYHVEKGERHHGYGCGPEPNNDREQKDNQALYHCNGSTTEGSAKHNFETRHRCNQRLLEEPETPVPQDFNTGKGSREEDAHSDDAWRQELDIITASSLRIDWSKTESKGYKEKEGLPQGSYNTRFGPEVALQLPEPEDIDDLHRRCLPNILRRVRICSRLFGSSSLISRPVRAINAPSRELVPVWFFNSSSVP